MRSSTDEGRLALVSLLLVAFVGLKAVELVGRVESWPLTLVPMFSRYRAPAEAPWSVELEGLDAGRWRPVTASEIGLTRDEMLRRIQGSAADVSRGCGALWRAINASRRPADRLDALRARVVRVPRPGVPDSPPAAEVVLPCP